MELKARSASVYRMKRRLGLAGFFAIAGIQACGEDAIQALDAGPEADAGSFADAGLSADSGASNDTGVVTDAGPTTNPMAGRIDLGPIQLQNGASAPLGFELPTGLSSFMVVIRGDENAMYVVESLTGPTGTLVDDQAPSDVFDFLLGPFPAQYKSPNRVVAQREGISAALFPNNPNVSVSGGAYTMTIAGLRTDSQQGSPVTGTAQVEVLYKEGAVLTGRLDVGLYFSGAGGITAYTAPSDPLISAALEKLRRVYAQANITIGRVGYFDIDSSYQTISNLAGPGNQLNEMFKLSQTDQKGLHYFFVDRIESPLGGVVGGVAGGLPGPASGQGTTGAGVAVALAAANGDAELLGHVMSHEGGHWLGLSHTTELLLPGIEDQLPDTPAGSAGTMNVMYPDGTNPGPELSASQTEVMRKHLETINP